MLTRDRNQAGLGGRHLLLELADQSVQLVAGSGTGAKGSHFLIPNSIYVFSRIKASHADLHFQLVDASLYSQYLFIAAELYFFEPIDAIQYAFRLVDIVLYVLEHLVFERHELGQ